MTMIAEREAEKARLEADLHGTKSAERSADIVPHPALLDRLRRIVAAVLGNQYRAATGFRLGAPVTETSAIALRPSAYLERVPPAQAQRVTERR